MTLTFGDGLVSGWAYLAVLLGTFVEGEAVLLCAGALAQRGQLSLQLVVVAGAAGSLAWGQLWYYVGRTFGRAFIDRRPKWGARSADVEHWLFRYGGYAIVAFRFIAGMAIVLPVLIGAGRCAPRRFLVLDGIGALLWASLFACAGYAMSAGLQAMLERPAGWPELIAIGVGGLLVVWLATQLVRVARVRSKAKTAW